MRCSNLTLRIGAAVVFIPVYLYALYAAETLLLLINLVIVLAATFEFMTLGRSRRDLEVLPTLLLAGYCHLLMSQGKPGAAASSAAIPFVVVLLMKIISGNPRETMLRASKAAAAVLYISWLFGHIYLIRSCHGSLRDWEVEGWRLAMTPIVLTWLVDTGAYGIGRLLGKRPLAPAVSPKKTWEGAIGGFVVGVVGGFAISLFGFVPAAPAIAIGVLAGTFGQLGDLSESLLKREADVKDSSSLIPGHGGVLDRFDSLLINVPGTYYLLTVLAPAWH
jgi:phosphatidate cytidylyltransferase